MAAITVEHWVDHHDKQADSAFLNDLKPLLRADIEYDAEAALILVKETLIQKLPGAPWRGLLEKAEEKTPKKARRKRTRRRPCPCCLREMLPTFRQHRQHWRDRR